MKTVRMKVKRAAKSVPMFETSSTFEAIRLATPKGVALRSRNLFDVRKTDVRFESQEIHQFIFVCNKVSLKKKKKKKIHQMKMLIIFMFTASKELKTLSKGFAFSSTVDITLPRISA